MSTGFSRTTTSSRFLAAWLLAGLAKCDSRSASPMLRRGAKTSTRSLVTRVGMSWMSGVMPTSWMLMSPGVRYLAMVSLSALSSGKS